MTLSDLSRLTIPQTPAAKLRESTYGVVGCKLGKVVRLERRGTVDASKTIQKLRDEGWAVSVFAPIRR